MANSYINPRGSHVAPGIYTNEIEVQSSVKSLGITSLGLVGETVKGPAFENIPIRNWKEYQDMFGGTNPELFKGSQYPKYELPYIAKSYLTESENLNVVRVLGLSGYNAGPAWVITASKASGTKYVVAVLRSRGEYRKYNTYTDEATACKCGGAGYDVQHFYVGEKSSSDDCSRGGFDESALTITSYTNFSSSTDCSGSTWGSGSPNGWNISALDRGRFTLSGYVNGNSSDTFSYAVTLNPNDKDYILKVLGTSQSDGDAYIYVESLYDVALEQAIEGGVVNQIDSPLTFFDVQYTADYCWHEPVDGILEIPDGDLKKKHVGMRFLATAATAGATATEYNYGTGERATSGKAIVVGQIYTVRQYTDSEGKRVYEYSYYNKTSLTAITDTGSTEYVNADGVLNELVGATSGSPKGSCLVYNSEDGFYYRKGGNEIKPVTLNLNDYKSSYRYASTPWFVSNLKGDASKMIVNKLFRFHTISDGDAANYLVKVSIENIRPDEGTFDVVIRDINDTDYMTNPLERFTKCNMIPGDSRYIAYQIGSFDGQYESKSKYVTVEVIESTATRTSVPAGFLGYPVPQFSGTPITGSGQSIALPELKYNCNFDSEIKNKRQYFGLSSIVGVDIDNFTFKGNMAYVEDDVNSVTNGFHLDARLSKTGSTIYVDDIPGYRFATTSINARTANLPEDPIIDSEANMQGSIFEYTNLRKFTAYFYGGFDGWDVYRQERSIGNEFKKSQYGGFIGTKSGEGYSFDQLKNPDELGLNQNGITSDWYAYLAGVRQFANPNNVDINVLAVPNVDPINASLLTEEIIDMVEEERGDTLYIMNLPDKPKGAGDYPGDMYTADEIVSELDASEVTSNYAATYYPWVKILDSENGQYLYVSPTKDVVRNLALTDNVAFSWYAPAGYSRGNVDCVKAKKNLVLADEDELYTNGINPIKTFGADGVKVFGQKTLSADQESLLSRIAVRRLLLRVKKLISNAAIGLIFDPYDSTTKQSFISTVAPILDGVKANRGLMDYRIEVDDSVENRMKYELPCRIFLKPTATLEYISISFVLTPQNVEFDSIM